MGAGKILVVDDDREVRMATRDFLTSKGHDVTLAEDGVQALKLLATVKPDVVLLDVAMPELDGMEKLRRIVAGYSNLPGIMVTANADLAITSNVLPLAAPD